MRLSKRTAEAVENDFAVAARAAKVSHLVLVLHMVGIGPEDCGLLSDPEVRVAAEKAAGVRPGSEITWAAVREAIRSRPRPAHFGGGAGVRDLIAHVDHLMGVRP